MAGVFESYEHQFSTITADITARIGKIPNLVGTEKKTAVGVVQGNIDEARELLDQMDLEIHDIPSDVRPQYKQRLTSYKHELERLKKDFKQAQVAIGDETMMRGELFKRDELHTSEDQVSTHT
jgi:vesicle transport through interaction with t-SNAREs protein 1